MDRLLGFFGPAIGQAPSENNRRDKSDGAAPLIRGNGEVHGDASFGFYRNAVLKVGLKVPLLHGFARSHSKNGGAAEDLKLLDAALT
jgi:hypothetical protein